MALLPIHVFLSILFLQALRASSSNPEEAFSGYPLQADEDEGYIYLDSRAEPAYSPSSFKQSETRRRSILDKNFARFGRSGGYNYNPMKTKLLNMNMNTDPNVMKNMMLYNMGEEDAPERDNFGRNSRSGEKSDQFIRFGRGKSDFVRFGRADPYTRDRDFIRFGRSTRSINNIKTMKSIPSNNDNKKQQKPMKIKNLTDETMNRKKRATPENLEFFKKTGSNFVRFGRGDRINDNFMRFGRMMNDNYLTSGSIHPLNTNGHLNGKSVNSLDGNKGNNGFNGTNGNMRKLLQGLQGQQSHELLLRMLIDLLSRSHLHKELQQFPQTLHPQASLTDECKERMKENVVNRCN